MTPLSECRIRCCCRLAIAQLMQTSESVPVRTGIRSLQVRQRRLRTSRPVFGVKWLSAGTGDAPPSRPSNGRAERGLGQAGQQVVGQGATLERPRAREQLRDQRTMSTDCFRVVWRPLAFRSSFVRPPYTAKAKEHTAAWNGSLSASANTSNHVCVSSGIRNDR